MAPSKMRKSKKLTIFHWFKEVRSLVTSFDRPDSISDRRLKLYRRSRYYLYYFNVECSRAWFVCVPLTFAWVVWHDWCWMAQLVGGANGQKVWMLCEDAAPLVRRRWSLDMLREVSHFPWSIGFDPWLWASLEFRLLFWWGFDFAVCFSFLASQLFFLSLSLRFRIWRVWMITRISWSRRRIATAASWAASLRRSAPRKRRIERSAAATASDPSSKPSRNVWAAPKLAQSQSILAPSATIPYQETPAPYAPFQPTGAAWD